MAKPSSEEATKVEPPKPHPVMEQLEGVQFCVNSPPPWPEAVLLGFQHYVMTLGNIVLITSVLVPQMGGSNADKAKVIQSQLFATGLNTLLQTLFGTRLPSVISGSYAYLIPVVSIVQAKRYKMLQQQHRFVHTMRGIQGGLLVASCFQMILGFLGLWRNVVRFLSPVSVVPLVCFTGLGLYYLGFPMLAKCVEIGLPELLLMIVISQYVTPYIKIKKPIWDRYALLFSVAIVWPYAQILVWSGAYKDSSAAAASCHTAGLINGAHWAYAPYPFQWGTPTFRAGESFAMMAAAFVSSIESTGSFFATARYGSATPIPPSVLSRGVGWLGFGTLLNGVLGGITGSTASVENAGILALTKVGSRRVVQISAAFMIVFSLLGKFGAVLATIPLPIMSGLYCIFFGYVTSAGLGHLQFCNLNSLRIKLILAHSFFLGLSIPQYFREFQLITGSAPVHTHSRWFNDIASVVFLSQATVATIVALFLDCTLPPGTGQHLTDSGWHWWQKFIGYDKDVRSDEFYKLPIKLNRLFPPY